jgi:diguanylate cyclase (GGDEF)-like protein
MSPVSLAMVDVDDFKRINDTFGHEIGDAVLAGLARTLRANLRGGDVVARYGGEEFVLLLPATEKLEAMRVVDRLRLAAALPVSPGGRGAAPVTVTVSAGLATFPADGKDSASLLRSSDRALCEAKVAGKNQVRLYGGSTRSFVRRRAVWQGSVRELESVARPVETVEIGEGGFMFISAKNLPVGTLLETHLVTPNGADIGAAGRVAWSKPLEDGRFEIAVRAIEHRSRQLELLARWANESSDA